MCRLLLVTILAWFAFASFATAHDAQHLTDWIGQHHYQSPAGLGYCCGAGDCGVMEDGAATPAPNGFRVVGHVLLVSPVTGQLVVGQWVDEFWPYDKTLPSEDDHFWRCNIGEKPRCTFVPPNFSEIFHDQKLAAID